MSYGHSHSNSNLPILLAGGRSLGVKHGQHIDYNQPHLKLLGQGKGDSPGISPCIQAVKDGLPKLHVKRCSRFLRKFDRSADTHAARLTVAWLIAKHLRQIHDPACAHPLPVRKVPRLFSSPYAVPGLETLCCSWRDRPKF